MKAYGIDALVSILQTDKGTEAQTGTDPDGEGACWPLSPHSPQASAWAIYRLVGRQESKESKYHTAV